MSTHRACGFCGIAFDADLRPLLDRRMIAASDLMDHGDEPTPADPDRLLEVDRVYLLDWSAFTDADWAALGRAYERLPGWVTTGEGCPRWFGARDEPPYLIASVEPPGLQISGVLSSRAWTAWDEAFRALVGPLPIRRLD
jgi:hypothetical protein